MRRADHSRFLVGKEDWRAVGGEDAEGDARHIGRPAVGHGTLVDWPGIPNRHDIGAVILINGEKPWLRHAECFRDHVAVAHYDFAIIARAHSAIERGEQSGRMSPLTGEEAVPEGFGAKLRCFDHVLPNGKGGPSSGEVA